jgi:hypothetical protein
VAKPPRYMGALLVLTLLLLLWPANALAADQVVTTDRTAAILDAFRGTLLWSRGASDGGARLVLLGQSDPTDVAGIAPGAGLFDAKLGRDRRGSLVAVYTRCAGLGGGDCDVYELDLATRRERRVKGVSSDRCSEFAPSIWRGTVAFARGGRRGCNGLYVRRPSGALRRLDNRAPAVTDVGRGRVAYLYAPPLREPSVPRAVGPFVIRMRSLRGGRSHIVVAGMAAQGSERSVVTNPVLAGRYVYWLHRDLGRREFFVGRSRGHRRSVLEFSDRTLPGAVESIAVGGRSLYYANGRGIFRATGPVLRFSPRD